MFWLPNGSVRTCAGPVAFKGIINWKWPMCSHGGWAERRLAYQLIDRKDLHIKEQEKEDEEARGNLTDPGKVLSHGF